MTDLESIVDQKSYAPLIDPIVQSLPLEQFGFTHTTNETQVDPLIILLCCSNFICMAIAMAFGPLINYTRLV